MSDKNTRNQPQVNMFMSIRSQLTIMLVLAVVLPLIVAGIWSLYTLQQASRMATEQSEAIVVGLGEAAISETAQATARQIELYLEMHPEIDLTDSARLENNADLAEIAVQPVGQTGYTAVFDASAITHFHANPGTVGMDMSTLSDKFPEFWAIFAASLDGSPSDGYYDWEDADGQIRAKYMSIATVKDTPLRVAATTYIDEFSQPVVETRSQLENIHKSSRNQLLLTIGGVIPVATAVALVYGRKVSRPISQITNAANRVAAGDLSLVDIPERGDEIGMLARAFNDMAGQLRQTQTRLEQRVADRTRALETSTEVSRRLSTILDPQKLAVEVVEQLQQAFNYYHAHIYLQDEASDDLIMVGGTGEAGRTMLARGHRIPHGKGLVGRAATTQEAVLIPDVSQETGWLPNPLLPETKSEIAVPIRAGDKVLGVLDVQQNVTDGLTQEDVNLLESIANQVAIALQNARSFTEVQRRAEQETRANLISQHIQRATTFESLMQTAARELGQAMGAQRVDVQLSPHDETK